VTTFAEGTLYAEDLRRIAAGGTAKREDLARCVALARWLARLHQEPLADPVAWRRAIRDLLGHGEGIFGIVDAYPPEVPAASPARLKGIEERCLDWRWRLRPRAERLRRTHGDFHPFNIVFGEGTRFTLLDASRGGKGDPADDVAALSINYLFFGLQAPAAWPRGFAPLWRTFHAAYLEGGGPRAVLESLPPFLAWRALVLSCPRFYPDLPAAARDALLGLAERALERTSFDPDLAEGLFP
jgi:aminoglycoside phosphotransferase (APT) family kinase protein